MISIAYQTEFVGCKMILSIFGNVGGTARITVRDTVTMDVVQAWKGDNNFWLECKGVNGEYFSNKFTGYDMVNTCESYFSALRTGYPLWEV